jgi:hypothetical protein
LLLDISWRQICSNVWKIQILILHALQKSIMLAAKGKYSVKASVYRASDPTATNMRVRHSQHGLAQSLI